MKKATKEMRSAWLKRAKEILKPECKDLKIETIDTTYEDGGLTYPLRFTAVTFTGMNGEKQHIGVNFL